MGEILLKWFQYNLVDLYSTFCGQQVEALKLWSDLLRKNPALGRQAAEWTKLEETRRAGVPDCMLLVTQRITKYPLILHGIQKVTEDEKEREFISHALSEARVSTPQKVYSFFTLTTF